nr:hypothetical protein BaRGS_016330 [Batillaria attramentaria]
MDSWARVDVPPDHEIMLSYPHLNLTGDADRCDLKQVSLLLYRLVNSTGRRERIFECKTSRRPGSRLYNDTSALLVHFTSKASDLRTGFRLYFTFHNQSAVPTLLENGLWNCSVPYWPDFRRHEPCDLSIDCDQGQDEVDCPYTSNVCGVGFIDAGGSCFQYRKEWQWADGTVAHYRSIIDNNIRPICSYFNRQDFPNLRITYCSVHYDSPHYICEFDVPPAEPPPTIRIANSPEWSAVINHTKCPDGHVTHEFLACDAKSACWATEHGACQAPMTQLPPSFTCADGVERVPYSLVCDYRPDCSDVSDEDFCIFPPCSLTEAFFCNNDQSRVVTGQRQAHAHVVNLTY